MILSGGRCGERIAEIRPAEASVESNEETAEAGTKHSIYSPNNQTNVQPKASAILTSDARTVNLTKFAQGWRNRDCTERAVVSKIGEDTY